MSHIKEAAKLNQLKYVFDDTLDNAKINELKTIGIGNFIDGAEWAINKACEWLEDNLLSYWQQCVTDPEEFIKEFHKAMEE